MTVWIKQGVCGDLSIPARKALGKVAAHWGEYEDILVTSIRDGNHMPGSLHYDGHAFDVRWPVHYEDRDVLLDALRDALGPDFDVVGEADHIHIEYDPKEA